MSTQSMPDEWKDGSSRSIPDNWNTLPVMLPEVKETGSRYQIHELLGMGGFGSVYRATDTRAGDEVAIKITRADKADNLAQQLNELDILQVIKPRCRENHVVCVRDHYVQRLPFNPSPGQLVIVMEYVPGETLRDRVPAFNKGVQPVLDHVGRHELLSIAIQLFEAIRFLHDLGISHKDIKPDNLIWHNGRLTLVDFGVACRARQCSDKSGTPQYMWLQLKRTPDPTPDLYKASDRYAAARTMLELVTWKAANDEQFSIFPALSKIMTDVVKDPNRHGSGEVLSRLRALWFKL
jgi:serine/threonine-protein kinase